MLMEITDSIQSDKKKIFALIQSIDCDTCSRLSSRQKIIERPVTRDFAWHDARNNFLRIAMHSRVTRMIVARRVERYLITHENEAHTSKRMDTVRRLWRLLSLNNTTARKTQASRSVLLIRA